MAKSQQGQRANLTGNLFSKKLISADLEMRGYIKDGETGKRYFLEHSGLFNCVFDKPWRADIFLRNDNNFYSGLVIECKTQTSGGSVYQKFPYAALSLKRFTGKSLIILDGGGYPDYSLEYLKRQVDDKLIAVLSFEEFREWARVNL